MDLPKLWTGIETKKKQTKKNRKKNIWIDSQFYNGLQNIKIFFFFASFHKMPLVYKYTVYFNSERNIYEYIHWNLWRERGGGTLHQK